MGLLFERGLPANPKYVYEALRKNDTELLQGALNSLEIHGDSKWERIIEKIKCLWNHPNPLYQLILLFLDSGKLTKRSVPMFAKCAGGPATLSMRHIVPH